MKAEGSLKIRLHMIAVFEALMSVHIAATELIWVPFISLRAM